MGWDYTDQLSIGVDDGECRLLMAHGAPGGNFLVYTRSHSGGVAIHQGIQGDIGGRTQQIFYSKQAEEVLVTADHNVAGAFVMLLHQSRAGFTDPLLRGEHWYVMRCVLRRGFKTDSLGADLGSR